MDRPPRDMEPDTLERQETPSGFDDDDYVFMLGLEDEETVHAARPTTERLPIVNWEPANRHSERPQEEDVRRFRRSPPPPDFTASPSPRPIPKRGGEAQLIQQMLGWVMQPWSLTYAMLGLRDLESLRCAFGDMYAQERDHVCRALLAQLRKRHTLVRGSWRDVELLFRHFRRAPLTQAVAKTWFRVMGPLIDLDMWKDLGAIAPRNVDRDHGLVQVGIEGDGVNRHRWSATAGVRALRAADMLYELAIRHVPHAAGGDEAQLFEALPTGLERVALVDCGLKGQVPWGKLPRSLLTVDLRHNQLHGPIQLDQAPPQLKKLLLADNAFDTVTGGVAALPQLSTLDVRDNQLSPAEEYALHAQAAAAPARICLLTTPQAPSPR